MKELLLLTEDLLLQGGGVFYLKLFVMYIAVIKFELLLGEVFMKVIHDA